jgi:hypothetical protein
VNTRLAGQSVINSHQFFVRSDNQNCHEKKGRQQSIDGIFIG